MENGVQNSSGSAVRRKMPRRSMLQWLLRVIQGALIGAGAILPGISGGVLCVVFGIYQPMMALLAHPVRAIRKYFKQLLPVLVGWLLGYWGLARVLNMLFNNPSLSNAAIWLFLGLIAGMLPQLFRDAGKQGRTYKSWIALAISFISVFALLLYLQYGVRISIQPNPWWYLVCGLLWGISLVVPGLSSSSLMLFLGLYQSMAAGVSNFSLEVVIPMVVGIVLVILLTARAINYMFDRHYASASHAVIGFVIASAIGIILPASGNTGVDGEIIGMTYTGDTRTLLLWVISFALGFLVAWLMDRVGKRIQITAQEKRI